MIDVDKAISTAVKTGKVILGANEALRSAKAGKARLVFLATNTPIELREDIEYYGKLSEVPVVMYKSNNVDLGMVCGKKFAVTALTVKEAGDSDVLKLIEKAPETSEEEAEE